MCATKLGGKLPVSGISGTSRPKQKSHVYTDGASGNSGLKATTAEESDTKKSCGKMLRSSKGTPANQHPITL